MERLFVVCWETNHKENETYTHYMQWDGNEKVLELFETAVNKSSREDMEGDYVSFAMTTKVKLSESAVNEHMKLNKHSPNYYAPMYTKSTGKIKDFIVSQETIASTNEYEMAIWLDETLFSCKLPKYFSDYRNYYEEFLYGKLTCDEYQRIVETHDA